MKDFSVTSNIIKTLLDDIERLERIDPVKYSYVIEINKNRIIELIKES